LKHSDLQSKTEETEKASVTKTIAAAGAMETALEPRRQKRLPPDGVVIVSGNLQRQVVKSKSSRKQKKAGTTGKGDIISCDEYDRNIPLDTSCYNSSFGLGGPPWGADPYSMYFMANMASSSYPMSMVSVTYHCMLLECKGTQQAITGMQSCMFISSQNDRFILHR
jgi:E3 ubiquitin-protein ligase RBBP6